MGTCRRTVIPFLVKRKVKAKVFALSHDKSLGSVFIPHTPPFYFFFFTTLSSLCCWLLLETGYRAAEMLAQSCMAILSQGQGKLFSQPQRDLRCRAAAGLRCCPAGRAGGGQGSSSWSKPTAQSSCVPWAEVAEGASMSLRTAGGTASPWESHELAGAWGSGRAPGHVPYVSWDGSHRHTPLHLRTFRSCSSSSIFGAPWAFVFSWGSSDSASLSEIASAASVLAAAGEEMTGQPFSHRCHGAANSGLETPCQGGQSRCRRGQGKSQGLFPTGAGDESLKLKRREDHWLCVLMAGVLPEGRHGK